MVARIKDILKETLENLGEDSFKLFKWKLSAFDVPPEFNKIPKGKLENANVLEVTDLIICYYTIEHGPEIVIKVLEEIDQRQASLDLKNTLKRDWTEKTPLKENGRQNPPNAALIHQTAKNRHNERENQSVSLMCDEGSLQEVIQRESTRAGDSYNSPESTLQNNQLQRLPLRQVQTNSNMSIARTRDVALFGIITAHVWAETPERANINVESQDDIENIGNSQRRRAAQPMMTTSSNSSPSFLPETSDNVVPALDTTNQAFGPQRPPLGKPLPDMKLVALKKSDNVNILQNHEGKPHLYAKSLFQHFVPFEIYKSWTRKTNFDGSPSKNAIPNNLRNAILKRVRMEFTLTKEDRKEIRKTINELLRNPRKREWKKQI
ncbi:uncharacterized protein O3C94_018747 isoform 2-T2 [Discoglossus pictus]